MDDSELIRDENVEDPLHEIRRELDRALREKEELAKENRQLKDKEEEYYNQTGEAQQERDDLKKQLSNVEFEKVQVGRKLANLIEVHEKAAKENTALKSAEEKLKEVLEAQRAERETLDLQLKTSQRQVKDLRQDMTDLRKELKTVQGRLEDRNTAAESLHAELDEAGERIAELEKQIEAGETAQDLLQEVQHGLEDTFEHLGKNVAIDEYLMHIRNLQHSRPRRNPSEETLERTTLSEKARLVPKRQLSMADELNGFDTDEEDEPEESYMNYELVVPPVHNLIHEDASHRTHHRRFGSYTSNSPSNSPSRPYSSRYTRSISDGPKLNGIQSRDVDIDSSQHTLTNGDHPIASSPLSNGIAQVTDRKDGTTDLDDLDDLDSEDVQSALDKYRARYDALFQQLQDAQETNQHLEEQAAPRYEDLDERDHAVKTEDKDVDAAPHDTLPSKITRAGTNPWIYTVLATLFAIYFAFALHHERSEALWANDLGSYSARRFKAPGPFWQAVEDMIGFDRSRYG